MDGNISLSALNDGGPGSIGEQGREYLDYSPGEKYIDNRYYGEIAINYSHKFNDVHEVSGMLIGIGQSTIISAQNDNLESSLPRRNLGLSGVSPICMIPDIWWNSISDTMVRAFCQKITDGGFFPVHRRRLGDFE